MFSAFAMRTRTCLGKRKQVRASVATATLSVTSRHDGHDLSPKTLRPPYAYSYSSNIRASAINAQLRRPHPCPRLLHLSLWLINPAPPPYRPGSIRARRAQQFIAQVDLEKIVEHDPAEFEKLGKASRAMESICAEEDKPAATLPDMTDPIEEAPTLDEHDQKRSELMSVLDAAGYGDRLGRIYMSNFDDPIRPLDLIPHIQGLPVFDVCVAPEHSPPDGAQGLFVSEQGIFAAFIAEPATRHKWKILRSRRYDDHAELLTTIRRFSTLPE